MNQTVLFCKSYSKDVLRAKRLLDSIQLFNKGNFKFFISTPKSDSQLFRNTLGESDYTLVEDENIFYANTKHKNFDYKKIKGNVAQQVIKSEFWRLGECEQYVCLDSDAVFLKSFTKNNFLDSHGNVYTVMHDAKEFLSLAQSLEKTSVVENFQRESLVAKAEFQRQGPDYAFGPAPFIWSSKVWDWLAESHLSKRDESILEAITRIPTEMRWYGEALLKSEIIPVLPIDPLFRVYHYKWQYDRTPPEKRNSCEDKQLGIIYQSNWDTSLDPPFAQKSLLSRLWRKLKS